MTFDGVNADGGMEVMVASHVGRTGSRAARREVHERLQGIVQRRGGLDVEEARWLLEAERLEVFRDHDCATTPTTTTIPQAIRTRVFRRDHRRCVVPGCRSGRYLEMHHVVFREHGGDHRMSNIALTCAAHHDDVHRGRLVIRGDANAGLEFVDADGRPWGAPTWESTAALVRSGLRNAGFKPHEATAAVERAVAEVGCETGVEALLRAALQACPRPRMG